jgi:PAS domain S-box-containing protein
MHEHTDMFQKFPVNALMKALDIAHLGCWEWNIQDGTELWSDEQFRIFGYEPGEIEPTYEHFVKALHQDDRSRVLDAAKKTLDGEMPFKIEFRIIRPDGTERTILSQGEVCRDEDNEPIRMVGTVLDITEQKQAEDAMRKSEERLKYAQRIAHLGNWDWDIASDNLYWSDEIYRIFDIDPVKFEGTYEAFLNSVNPDDRAHVMKSVDEALNEKKPYSIEHRIILPDGTERIVQEHAVVTFNDDGRPIRMFGVVQDVTSYQHTLLELIKKEQEYLRSQMDLRKLAGRLITAQENELRRLARDLHDDLTQKLAVTAIEAGSIEQGFKDLPGPVLQKIVRIKEQLIKISKDVHNLSRDLHPSILDDLGLERAVQLECSNFSSRTGIAVVFTPKNIPGNMSSEISLSIYRIIQEGLSNIVKHADTKNAYVFLEAYDHSILLTVRDTGAGFDQNDVRQQAALGLGSIRERVRLVNGQSSITSSPGKGTSIEVKIPLKRE